MATQGDTKERFGRSYIYLVPTGSNFDPGTWRVRVDDEGTPPIDGGGGGGDDTDLTFRAVLANDETATIIGNLLYIDNAGQARKASAASIATAEVAGMALTATNPGELVTFGRNETKEIYDVATIVDGSPGLLTPGGTYFLSMNPGKWTTTPDTTTPGAVVRNCGVAMDTNQMSIEVQTATVI